MLIAIGLVIGGLVLATLGADVLVRGASRTAARVGVSSLVIGLTVVAFGTSAPEAAISVIAATQGQADISLGNVVGSNIFNILVVLGASALVAPLAVARSVLRFDTPLLVLTSLALVVLASDGRIGHVDGTLLMAGLIAYVWVTLRRARRDPEVAAQVEAPDADAQAGSRLQRSLPWNLGLIVAGLVLLVLGSRWLVAGAADIARALGVSELVIGLTIVAAGTSVPEVATSIVAALRGERDIAVGNVIGSSLFNILGVLGLAGLVSPLPVQVATAAMTFDIPIMIGTAALCLPLFANRLLVTRSDGAVLVALYLAYLAVLIVSASQPVLAPRLMQGFLAGAALLTGVWAGVQSWRARRWWRAQAAAPRPTA